jgi:hypothetical protein
MSATLGLAKVSLISIPGRVEEDQCFGTLYLYDGSAHSLGPILPFDLFLFSSESLNFGKPTIAFILPTAEVEVGFSAAFFFVPVHESIGVGVDSNTVIHG